MAEIVGKMDISSSVTSPGANATQMTEVVEFPRPVMIFAAICASIFTVVGIGGKDDTKFTSKFTQSAFLFNPTPSGNTG